MSLPNHHLLRHFDELYEKDVDPWKVGTAWYEIRKRAMILAALPHKRYGIAYELGCGNGELSTQLALRCDHLIAIDGSATAIKLTRERLLKEDNIKNVVIEKRILPHEWPKNNEKKIDLIVISEIAYYFNSSDLFFLIENVVNSLAIGGVLILCHWRAAFSDRVQSAFSIHSAFKKSKKLSLFSSYKEKNFLLDVFLLH